MLLGNTDDVIRIIEQARNGRPDLAAINAGLLNRPKLAAYISMFPHESGYKFSCRTLVESAIRAERCFRHGVDIYGDPLWATHIIE